MKISTEKFFYKIIDFLFLRKFKCDKNRNGSNWIKDKLHSKFRVKFKFQRMQVITL